MDKGASDFVRQRAGNRCEYCGLPQDASALRFHIEHIIARQHGGNDDTMNLALACPECNYQKGTNLSGIDPDTGKTTLLFHPRVTFGRPTLPATEPESSGKRRLAARLFGCLK
jgi:hypothetical protein